MKKAFAVAAKPLADGRQRDAKASSRKPARSKKGPKPKKAIKIAKGKTGKGKLPKQAAARSSATRAAGLAGGGGARKTKKA